MSVGGRVPSAPASVKALRFAPTDQAGSLRSRWDLAGNMVTECTSFPYGEGYSCAGATPPTLYTGKDRDPETGFDYFGARYYSSSMGRFTSPDWSAKEVPVPYANLNDPQSLNLYTYVGNRPVSNVDPDGHEDTAEFLERNAPAIFNAQQEEDQLFSGTASDGDNQQQRPPVDPPRGANGEKNKWVQRTPSGNGDRDVAWESEFPTNRIPQGKGSKAGASWDPGDDSKGNPGYWDIDTGYGDDRRRYLPDGTQIDHWGNPSNNTAGLPLSKQVGNFVSDHSRAIAGVALITGAILLAPETGGVSLIFAF